MQKSLSPTIFSRNLQVMSLKKEYSFTLIIIAVILGSSIYRQFDFEKMQFEKPVLVAVYFVAFILALYFIFKKDKPAA